MSNFSSMDIGKWFTIQLQDLTHTNTKIENTVSRVPQKFIVLKIITSYLTLELIVKMTL